MRKISLFIALIAMMCLQSCFVDEAHTTIESHVVYFDINTNVTTTNGRTTQTDAAADAVAFIVSLTDHVGDTVLNHKRIELLTYSNSIASEPVLLMPGTYNLVAFFALDSVDKIIYATPKDGTLKAQLVDVPLDFAFDVTEDSVTHVPVEVLPVANSELASFGYGQFVPSFIETFSFEISVFEHDTVTSYVQTLDSAELSILVDGTERVSRVLPMGIQSVEVRADGTNYEVVLSKFGYGEYRKTFTKTELAGYVHSNSTDELRAYLTYTITSGTFKDSGQRLGSESGREIAIGDLDGDGDIDAYVVNGTGYSNRVWLNDGSGNFTDSGIAISPGEDSFDVQLADLDGDGDLDAFHGNLHENSVWLNDGSASFSQLSQSFVDEHTTEIAIGDLDNDGDIDVVTGSTNAPYRDYHNDGTGVFSLYGNTNGNVYRAIALSDMDGDGYLDAIKPATSGANILGSIILNDGSGVFLFNPSVNLVTNSELYVAEDFTGDNVPDLACSGFDNYLRVFTNQGSLTFSAVTPVPMLSAADLQSGDFNQDGFLDLVSIYGAGNDSRIWLNNGNGAFTQTSQLLANEDSRAVGVADFNGDGILDLFCVNAGLTGHRVFFGQP